MCGSCKILAVPHDMPPHILHTQPARSAQHTRSAMSVPRPANSRGSLWDLRCEDDLRLYQKVPERVGR